MTSSETAELPLWVGCGPTLTGRVRPKADVHDEHHGVTNSCSAATQSKGLCDFARPRSKSSNDYPTIPFAKQRNLRKRGQQSYNDWAQRLMRAASERIVRISSIPRSFVRNNRREALPSCGLPLSSQTEVNSNSNRTNLSFDHSCPQRTVCPLD